MSLKVIRKHMTAALNAALNDDAKTAAREISKATGLLDDAIRQRQESPASQLGALGGQQTAKRGPDYFRELAARRKTHGGGRPRKDAA